MRRPLLCVLAGRTLLAGWPDADGVRDLLGLLADGHQHGHRARRAAGDQRAEHHGRGRGEQRTGTSG